MNRRITGSRLRATAVVPAVALVAAGFAAAGTSASVGGAAPSPASVPAADTHGDYYLNTVAPRAEAAFGSRRPAVSKGDETEAAAKQAAQRPGEGQGVRREALQGQPGRCATARQARGQGDPDGQEPEGDQAASSSRPRRRRRPSSSPSSSSSTSRRTTTSPGSMVPRRLRRRRPACPAHVQNGPTHNKIPNPADSTLQDNNSMWVPDFSSAALQHDALHQEGHHRAGPHRTSRAPTASPASTSPATR